MIDHKLGPKNSIIMDLLFLGCGVGILSTYDALGVWGGMARELISTN